MSSIESNWTSLFCNFCGILEIKLSFSPSLSLSLFLSHRGKSNLSFYNPNCENSKSVQADPIFLSVTQNWETSKNDSFQQPLLPPPLSPRKRISTTNSFQELVEREGLQNHQGGIMFFLPSRIRP